MVTVTDEGNAMLIVVELRLWNITSSGVDYTHSDLSRNYVSNMEMYRQKYYILDHDKNS